MKETRNNLVVVAMALGLLMASLDNTITSAAISHIIKDIGGFNQMSWVFTGYILAETSTLLVFGKMSDLFGRKRLYLIGVGIFLVGSALCGMAQSMPQLIAFRILQGVGAGAILPISFTLIFALFRDPKQAAKLSGIFGGIFGLSAVAGPLIGTWIAEHLNWRWCFYVNLPVGIIAFLILLFALQESRAERKAKIDYWGTLLVILCTVSLMLALEWAGNKYDWLSLPIISLISFSIILALIFIKVEQKAEEPILPLQLFRNRLIATTSLTVLCQGAIMFSAITYLPIFAVGVLGQENSNTLLSPLMLSLTLGAIIGSFLINKFSFRSIMASAMITGIIAGYLLVTAPLNASNLHMIVIMAILGFGAIGPLMSVAQYAVATSVDKKYLGVISSIVGFWRNIGGILGASIMATIVNYNFRDLVETKAAQAHIPLEMVEKPDVLMDPNAPIPTQILTFLRESLGTSIHYGFIIIIVFATIGVISAMMAGPGKQEEEETESNINIKKLHES